MSFPKGRAMFTKDLSLFRPNDFQREHRDRDDSMSTAAIRSNMTVEGWRPYDPMWVYPKGKDGLREIAKGHHRYELAKELGIGVWFIEVDPTIPIWEIELGDAEKDTKWDMRDGVVSHAKRGVNKDYSKLLEFVDGTGISTSTSIKLLTLGGSNGKGINAVFRTVRMGDFKITNAAHAEEIGSIIKYCKYNLNLKYATKDGFVNTISLLRRADVVPIKTLLLRMKRQVHILQKRLVAADYFEALSSVYNWNQGTRIDFGTEVKNYLHREKAAHGRKMVQGKKNKITVGAPVYEERMAAMAAR